MNLEIISLQLDRQTHQTNHVLHLLLTSFVAAVIVGSVVLLQLPEEAALVAPIWLVVWFLVSRKAQGKVAEVDKQIGKIKYAIECERRREQEPRTTLFKGTD